MSKEQFELERVAIEAIAADGLPQPNMPVSIALQEAEDLYEWCQPDKTVLVAAGLDWTQVEGLQSRIGACRYAQSVWQKEYQSPEAAQKAWKEQSPAAFTLRDDLVHHCLHAFRNDPVLLKRAQNIAEGDSNADMVQDLSDLSVLGIENPAPLAAIKVDATLFTLAATKAEEMADLLAQANGEHRSKSQLKITRDKAFAHMKKVVDEIRLHGQYKFWHDDERRKGYVSRYLQLKNKETRKPEPEEPKK
jgi:hypothetical protein